MTAYVIDNHPLMRDALTMLIHRIRPGLKVVPVARMSLLDSAVEKHGPRDLFCLTLELPDTLGMSGVQAIKANYPDAALAVVTGSDASEIKERCLEAGADVFIEKKSSANQIISDLRQLLITPESCDDEQSGSGGQAPSNLSKRQKQLILMLDQGMSNKDIAATLDISEHTVKVHCWRLFRRIGVSSRTQVLHFARTNGWL